MDLCQKIFAENDLAPCVLLGFADVDLLLTKPFDAIELCKPIDAFIIALCETNEAEERLDVPLCAFEVCFGAGLWRQTFARKPPNHPVFKLCTWRSKEGLRAVVTLDASGEVQEEIGEIQTLVRLLNRDAAGGVEFSFKSRNTVAVERLQTAHRLSDEGNVARLPSNPLMQAK